MHSFSSCLSREKFSIFFSPRRLASNWVCKLCYHHHHHQEIIVIIRNWCTYKATTTGRYTTRYLLIILIRIGGMRHNQVRNATAKLYGYDTTTRCAMLPPGVQRYRPRVYACVLLPPCRCVYYTTSTNELYVHVLLVYTPANYYNSIVPGGKCYPLHHHHHQVCNATNTCVMLLPRAYFID